MKKVICEACGEYLQPYKNYPKNRYICVNSSCPDHNTEEDMTGASSSENNGER